MAQKEKKWELNKNFKIVKSNIVRVDVNANKIDIVKLDVVGVEVKVREKYIIKSVIRELIRLKQDVSNNDKSVLIFLDNKLLISL